MRRKGFTLIELIVVMGILAILMLLGVPKYKEYTNEAQLTRIKVNVKELETAINQYYIRNNDWPRLSDISYTSEQIENYSTNILDKTGQVVVLEENGNYYDIGYDKIKNYIKEPKDSYNYILQNPVGNIFYIEGITEEGKERTTVVEEKEEVEWVVGDVGQGSEVTLNSITGRAANIGKTSGKWYWEVTIIKSSGGATWSYGLGISTKEGLHPVYGKNIYMYPNNIIRLCKDNYVQQTFALSYSNNQTIGVLLDLDNDKLYFQTLNGVLESPYKPSQLGSDTIYAYVCSNSGSMTLKYIANFGEKSFNLEQPEGYRAYNLVEKQK